MITIGELRREVEEEKLKQSQMLDITTKTLTAQLTQQFTHEREIQVNSLTNRFTKQVQALTAVCELMSK